MLAFVMPAIFPLSIKETAMTQHVFVHPVVVIIPVFNAYHYVFKLIESIQVSISIPLSGLYFLVCDDASWDLRLSNLYESHTFFKRSDVTLVKHAHNQGFIKNVNAACVMVFKGKLFPKEADVVWLNSDTEIHDNVFLILQQEAYRAAHIASVTPLSNQATLASVFDYPNGQTPIPWGLSAKQVSHAVAKMQLDSPYVPAPTGVGFCMYVRHRALTAVGLLDETYGAGYGEECDWCQRAIDLGFIHIVSTRAFVYHAGTQSFTNTHKKKAIQKNETILLSRYSHYNDDVSMYLHQLNPLRFHRMALQLCMLKIHGASKSSVLFVLHEPSQNETGGTERHVAHLKTQLLEQSHVVLEMYPVLEHHQFVVFGKFKNTTLFKEYIDLFLLSSVISLLSSWVDTLHVHHLIKWPNALMTYLQEAPIVNKIITLHDYYVICPSVNLLKNRQEFCHVEPDIKACNECLSHYNPQFDSILDYRYRFLNFLKNFRILVPSLAALNYFEHAWSFDATLLNKIKPSVAVEPHALSYLSLLTEQTPKSSKRIQKTTFKKQRHLIVLVGLIGKHKGAKIIESSLKQLNNLDFDVEIIGALAPDFKQSLKIPVWPYKNYRALFQILEQKKPMIVAFPSITAETYCYSFFESCILSRTGVPVVSSLGNPAQEVAQYQIGAVMSELSSGAFVDACLLVRNKYEHFLDKKQCYVDNVLLERVKIESLPAFYGYEPRCEESIYSEKINKTISTIQSINDQLQWFNSVVYKTPSEKDNKSRLMREKFKKTLAHYMDEIYQKTIQANKNSILGRIKKKLKKSN